MKRPGYVILQTLAAQAWADGQLKPCERRFLVAVARDNHVPIRTWSEWLQSPPPLPSPPTLEAALPDPSSRLDLMTQMLALSWADREVTREEWALVEAVGQTLGIPQDALQSIFECLAA